MGIVFRQSARNTLVTYLGFGIGAINTLFLYTRFLSPEYYGLVGVILSTGALLMPLMAFGVPNAMVKYFSSYQQESEKDAFMSLMLLLPLSLIIPLGLFSYLFNGIIADFLARENAVVGDYVWHIFLVGAAMAYFEVFYAWAKVHLRSVSGNFMKEVFARAGVSLLLLAVYTEMLTVDQFLNALVFVYVLRTLIMGVYSSRLRRPRLELRWPEKSAAVLKYSALIILGGSAAVMILELDRFMINQFVALENVAFYSVAVFIATVIAVPSRAMHQVTYPLTAEIMNRASPEELRNLYQKSSLTLFIVSGFLFVLIMVNLEALYLLLPGEYSGGFVVVFVIGVAKVSDALLGNNNAILFNSEYYGAVLGMGVFLAILTIVFNLWLIPVMGINGAALASLMAIGIYNAMKLYYVWLKFGIQPFSSYTAKVLLLLAVLGLPVYFINLGLPALIVIGIKTLVFSVLFLLFIYRFRWSEDIRNILDSLMGR